MFQIKLSESTAARRRIPVLLVDSTDGFTPKTGQTAPTVTISKNGATAVSGAGTFTEVANGVYYYEFTVGEADTLGWIALNVQKATCRQYNAIIQVMAYDYAAGTNLGLSNLNDTITSRMATFTYTAPPSVTDIWNTNVSGYTIAGYAGTYQKNLDAAITTRMASFTYTAPPTTTDIWSATTRTLTASLDPTAAQIWAAATRTLTSGAAPTTADIWTYATRTLTSGAAPSTADIWTYATRTLTSGAAPSATTIADAVLNRKLDSTGDGTDTLNERTVRSALRAMRNKVSVASGVMTVTKEDDTTTAWSATLSNTANVTVDPT